MRLSKFLFFAGFITFFSLIYVFQQSEIIRLAYEGQKRQAFFQDLLDKNTLLRYNIETCVSLTRIGDRISGNKDYEMPGTYQLVKLTYPLENFKVKARLAKKENFLARFFSIKREAQAQER